MKINWKVFMPAVLVFSLVATILLICGFTGNIPQTFSVPENQISQNSNWKTLSFTLNELQVDRLIFDPLIWGLFVFICLYLLQKSKSPRTWLLVIVLLIITVDLLYAWTDYYVITILIASIAALLWLITFLSAIFWALVLLFSLIGGIIGFILALWLVLENFGSKSPKQALLETKFNLFG